MQTTSGPNLLSVPLSEIPEEVLEASPGAPEAPRPQPQMLFPRSSPQSGMYIFGSEVSPISLYSCLLYTSPSPRDS
eukprot:3509569-Prorocentrum_lima.AAC.1